MKKLYILIKNCADSSYSLLYTFDKGVVDSWEYAYDIGKVDYESGVGIDGEGFTARELNVPDDFTYETLGISESQVLGAYVNKCPYCLGSGKMAKAAILPEPPDVNCLECGGSGVL